MVGDDPALGAEVEHLLRLGESTDERSGDAPALHDKLERAEVVRSGWSAEQDLGAEAEVVQQPPHHAAQGALRRRRLGAALAPAQGALVK